MLTIDQIKLIGIPKNTSRLNNRLLTPAALPNESVNLYQAVKLIIEDLNIGSSSTDLSIDLASTTISLNSSTGNGVVLPSATISTAGLMSATDKSTLDALVTLTGMGAGSLHLGQFTGSTIANNLDIKEALQALETAIETVVLPSGADLSTTYTLNDVTVVSATGSDAFIGAATASNAGVMTASDKIKLDAANTNISNVYTLIGFGSPGATSLGTFSGNIIPSNTTLGIALQSLETAIELFGAADGNGIYSGSGNVPDATVSTLQGSFALDTANSPGVTINIGNAVSTVNNGYGLSIINNKVTIGEIYGIGSPRHARAEFDSNGVTILGPGAVGLAPQLFLNNLGGGSLNIYGNFFVYDNGATPAGLQYADDYSATYNNRSLVDKQYVDGVLGQTTNITITQSNNTVTVNSSSGSDGTIIAASSSTAGVMTSGDKRRLDALVTLSGVAGEDTTLGLFTGTIIQDNRTIKQALQDIETHLDASVSGGGYAYTNGPSYTLQSGTRTVYAEANSSNISITAGAELLEGEVYYLYTRKDLSFGVTVTPASTYSLFVADGNAGAETITTPYTVPLGAGVNLAFTLQRRGNIIFLTRLA